MIRKWLSILFLCIGVSLSTYGQEREKLDKYIDSYLSMTPPIVDSMIVACDYLIGFSNDTTIKTHIAGYLFNRFYASPIMGMESVAIHIAKNYFINKELKWHGDDGMLNLRLFVEFNEHSLIGMSAPELNLVDTCGTRHSLREMPAEYTVVYFYDTDCNLCKRELPYLKDTIRKYRDAGVRVYAVYAQSDTNSLRRFIKSEFKDKEDEDVWTLVWDPEFESGFHKLYNVLKTPQMYLLDNHKKIIGRNLNHEALGVLLGSLTDKKRNLSNNINSFLNDYLKVSDLKDTSRMRNAIEPLFQKTTNGDIELYRMMFLQLFDILQMSDDTTYQACAIFVAKNYIVNKADLWWDSSIPKDYVPKMVERIQTNKVGSIANDFTFFTDQMKPVSVYEINSKYTVIYFYSPKCAICKPFGMELGYLYKSLKKRGVTFLAVDVDSDYNSFKKSTKENKTPWKRLYVREEDKLELFYKYRKEGVPMIYLLDNEKRIIAKKINTTTLNRLVK